MTSAIGKPNKASAAFTLLEIVLGLFIVMLIAGIAIPLAGGLGSEAILREPADALKKLAITARRAAVTERRSYEIILDNDRFVLRMAPPGDAEDTELRDSQILQEYQLPRAVKYAVKRWDQRDFGRRTDARWTFLPTGISEPVTVRFDRGEDWLQFSFNPLTALAEDETYYFR